MRRASAWHPGAIRRLAPQRKLLGDQERGLREVEEPPLVLEQLQARAAPLGRSRRRLKVLAALPPELRDPIVGLGPAAARPQHLVERVFPRVELDVPLDAQGDGVALHERTVLLPPVALEGGARQLGQTAQTED